ncbi:MAG: lasso peptide biosynthesis B2 protein [Actinomycetota bacterium]
MKRLRKFVCLPAGERWLLIKAALLLWTVKLALVLLPFRTLRRFAGGLAKPSAERSGPDSFPVEKVVWAVEAAGRLTPWARTCLTQALATQILLLRRGHQCRIHIGVVKGDGGEFLAHAWAESGGEVVIGGYELERYTRLALLTGENLTPVSE